MDILSKIGDLYMIFRSRVPSRFIGSRIVELNNIEVVHPNYLWTDKLFNARPDRFVNNIPDYEDELVKQVKEYVKEDYNVTIIGGGMGVTSIIAGQSVGESGSVTVFEGSKEFYDRIKRNIKHNNLHHIINVNHTIVGSEKNLYGKAKTPDRITPEELKECDLLEMDCEGTELQILENMRIRPEWIIVETHGIFNSPTDDVYDQLDSMGYNIVSVNTIIEEDDIKVITAQKTKA